MTVEVHEVVQPIGAFDTIIKFRGTVVDTESEILFGVDHRPARELIQMMSAASKEEDPDPVLAHVEDWQILMIMTTGGQS